MTPLAHTLFAQHADETKQQYENLTARLAGDAETEQLARRIQHQERQTAEKVFALLPAEAGRGYQRLVSTQSPARPSRYSQHG